MELKELGINKCELFKAMEILEARRVNEATIDTASGKITIKITPIQKEAICWEAF